MARRRLHSLDDLLDVAEQIVTTGDPAGLTLRGLAAEAGASNGTIYHAFKSKDELLAQLWLRAWSRLSELMQSALEGTDSADGEAAVVAVALAPFELLHRFPGSARLFFAQRRDQLFAGGPSADVEAELVTVHKQFVDLMVTLARGVWDRGDRHAVDTIATCVVDLPTGLLRRRLVDGSGVNEVVARHLEAAVRAVLAVPLEPHPRAAMSAPTAATNAP